MAIVPNLQKRTVHYDYNTKNQSFLDMHYFLKASGRKNHSFFLILFDSGLTGVDPRDPRLNTQMKQRILRECMVNFWYFLREVVRIPDQGGAKGAGMRYMLHRGNLALNFGITQNWNIFLELPRQNGKTISTLCADLWIFNFGTTNSEFMYINKKHEDSKMNLQRLKDIREALPQYLQMDSLFGNDGKKLKGKNNAETIEHPSNGNKIRTLPAAQNPVKANSLGRGWLKSTASRYGNVA